MSQPSPVTLEKLVSLCKRRAFVYQSAEIYGGLNGVYDMGPLGVLLKQNIQNAWTTSLKKSGKTIIPFEGSLLGPEAMWQASGHTSNFHDPLIDCLVCKHRYRADDIDTSKPCPHCGNTKWTDVREFHLMFKTQVGAATDQSSMAYLRPETAQSIFVNFKNIISSNRVKIPFGVAQMGKAFRNEITPKQFLFRVREFEQMEMEWFCQGETAMDFFTYWCDERKKFYETIGIKSSNIRFRAHEKDELSHYSSATSDVEYQFPFGWKELEGIAYRGNFDLTQHMKFSGKDLAVFDEKTQSSFVPHVVECSVGVGRLFLAVLFDAYHEELDNEGIRTVLRLAPQLAPVKAAFFPLTKTQAEPMEKIYNAIAATGLEVQYDLSGSIGKRYRRQDEIGTPLCFTYDFDSEKDQTVTVRHRDSMQQERISISAIADYISKTLNS
jgi:glycyl-tRNA synthetase